jgi:hypothetical protein
MPVRETIRKPHITLFLCNPSLTCLLSGSELNTMAKWVADSIKTDVTGENPGVASEDSEYMGEEVNTHQTKCNGLFYTW